VGVSIPVTGCDFLIVACYHEGQNESAKERKMVNTDAGPIFATRLDSSNELESSKPRVH
jgi:hypothetical protein